MPSNTKNSKSAAAGSILIYPHEPIKSVLRLESGLVRKFYTSPQGKEITVHIFKPDAVLLVSYLLSDTQNHCYYEALTPCSFKQLPAQEYLQTIYSDPKLQQAYLHRFARALSGLTQRVISGETKSLPARIRSIQSYLAKAFPDNTYTHQQLASWMGVSREAVSRALAKSSQLHK